LDSLAAVVAATTGGPPRPSISSGAGGPRTSVSSPAGTVVSSYGSPSVITPGAITLNTVSPSHTQQQVDMATMTMTASVSSPTTETRPLPTVIVTPTSPPHVVQSLSLIPSTGMVSTIPSLIHATFPPPNAPTTTPMNAMGVASPPIGMAVHSRVASVIAASGGPAVNKRGSGKFGNNLMATPTHRPAQPSFDHFSYGDIPVATPSLTSTSAAPISSNSSNSSNSAAATPLLTSSVPTQQPPVGLHHHSMSHSVPLHPRHLGGVLSHDYHSSSSGAGAAAAPGHSHRHSDDDQIHLYRYIAISSASVVFLLNFMICAM
jgi:hypothetical protein